MAHNYFNPLPNKLDSPVLPPSDYVCIIRDTLFNLFYYSFVRESQQDLFNAMGSMYIAVLFVGITNATAVQPVVSVERFVSYRERAAGMYSALPFAFAQVKFPAIFIFHTHSGSGEINKFGEITLKMIFHTFKTLYF